MSRLDVDIFKGRMQGADEFLELSITALGLLDLDVFTKSDPFAVLFRLENEKWEVVGKTEVVYNCLCPKFVKKFDVSLRTPQAKYKLVLYDFDFRLMNIEHNDELGECWFTTEMVSCKTFFFLTFFVLVWIAEMVLKTLLTCCSSYAMRSKDG